jgi:hypothetical protein
MMTNQSKRHSFAFPHEVVDDPSLGLSQKRAILSEWASDACAIKSFPTLRLLPGTNFPVTFSSIMDARSYLDQKFGEKRVEARIEDCVVVQFSKKQGKAHGITTNG